MVDDEDLRKLKKDLEEIFTADPKELQKKYQAEHEKKQNKRLAPFKHLWKIDDRDWVKQRQEDWKVIEAEFLSNKWSKSEINKCKRYYLKGEKTEYMDGRTLFFLTPLDTPNAALKFFLSSNFDNSMRDTIYAAYFRTTPNSLKNLPSLRKIIKIYVDGVLGPEYQTQISDAESGREYKFSEPTFWCKCFLTDAKRVLNGDLEYQGVVECLDYFVSCLGHIGKIRKSYVSAIFDLAETATQSKSETTKEFAENILARKDDIIDAISNVPDSHP